jgi:hypothetical protein
LKEVIFQAAKPDDVEDVWLETGELQLHALASCKFAGAEHDAKACAIEKVQFTEIDSEGALDERASGEVISGIDPDLFSVGGG